MSSSRRDGAGFAGLVLAAAGLSLWAAGAWSPPPPLPASAPAEAFSAERARVHLGQATAPRPLGSEAHEAARAYLLEELAALGLETQVQEATVTRRLGDDRFLAARVRNVLARLPGKDPSGALLLMAHYDTRPNTPGAGDDFAGVAAILETLRALTRGPAPANDVLVLLSDGEELGLLGARAFADQHPWAAEVSVALNFEARGNSGPVLAFESREGNLGIIRALRAAAPAPFASSMSYEVYRRMPNDTDFSVFRDAGVQGLNMAFIGNHAAYHTMLDAPEALDGASLQHLGSYALGLALYLGDADLRETAAGGEDAVYFNAYPWRLIVHPASWAPAPAVAGTALLLAGLLFAGRRAGLRLAAIVRGLLLFPVGLAAAAALGWSLWWLFRNYLGHALFGPHGLPYETGLLVLCLAATIAAALGALATWIDDGARPLELSAGGWLGWAVTGLALSWTLPGASFLVTWPLLFGALGVLAAALAGRRRQPAGELAEATLLLAAALPALWLLTPLAWTVAEAMSLRSAAVVGASLGLLLLPIAPQLAGLHRRSGGASSLLLAAVGVGLLVWVAATARPDARQPAVTTLAYALDVGSGEAWWASLDDELVPWTTEILGTGAELQPAPAALALSDTEVWLTAAPAASLSPPAAELVSDSRAGGRSLEVRAWSTRGAPVLRVRGEASVPLVSLSLEGETFAFEGDAAGIGEVWISSFGFGDEGLRFGLTVDEAWPIELELIDASQGFGALPEPPPARPPELIPSSGWRTDAVYVMGTALL